MSPTGFKEVLQSKRTAQKWDRLRRFIAPKDRLGIILYGEPDPDALGSAWALQHLLKEHLTSSRICATTPVVREQNKKFVKALGIPLEVHKSIPWDEFDKLAIVDAQPDFFPPEIENSHPFDIVIDHHPKKGAYSFKFSDVRPKCGSVSTILLEYLLWAGVRVTKKLATALWFGLRTDTDNLSTEVNDSDLAAYGFLYRRSDRNLLHWLEREEIPATYGHYYIDGLKNLSTRKKNIIAHLGAIEQADVCVQVADFLARFIGVKAIVIMGETKETLYVIMRGGNFSTNVGRLARKLKKYGSAGGHQSKARAEIPRNEVAKHVGADASKEEIEEWITKLLWRSRSQKK